MGCGLTCARVFLIFFTALLSLIGFGILGAGLLVKYGSKTILKPYLETVLDAIHKNIGSSDSSNTTTTSTGEDPDDVWSILDPISITLISFGAVIAVLSLIGFLGACCRNKCLLSLYAVFVALIISALVILSSIILSGAANDFLQSEILKTIKYNYYGLHGTNAGSLVWNVMMIQLGCCGLFDYQDFNSSESWERNVTIENYTVTLLIPVACCKMNGTFPEVEPSDKMCAIYPSDYNSNWKKGCWNEMSSKVLLYKPFVAVAIAVILLIMVFIVLWSCVVANKMNQVGPA